jgi:hypothetical protein
MTHYQKEKVQVFQISQRQDRRGWLYAVYLKNNLNEVNKALFPDRKYALEHANFLLTNAFGVIKKYQKELTIDVSIEVFPNLKYG